MIKKSLLLSVSTVIALGATGALAQTNAMKSDGFQTTSEERLMSESAELYASSMAQLAALIETAVANDSGTSVIAGLRNGRVDHIASIDADTRALFAALNLNAAVFDVDPGPDVDERLVIFIRDADLKQGVSRADVEREANRNDFGEFLRLQNGRATDSQGDFEITGNSELASLGAGLGIWLGISGNDKITSGDLGSRNVRVLACPVGQFGTGVVQEREVARETDLGGNAAETFTAWTEVERNCTAEYNEQVRFFDICPGPDGVLGTGDDDASGQSLYEATQYVRRSGSDVFETEIFRDDTTISPVDDAECIGGARLSNARDFLVNGRTQGDRELQLKTNTSGAPIGNGANRVPIEVSASGSNRVASIPFMANSAADYSFTGSCSAEFGNVAVPSGYTGPSRYSGTVSYHRDYNRRETYFTDDTREYILNYDIVLDPNPYGHGSKGRSTFPARHGGARSGDGWYRSGVSCSRDLTHPEAQTRSVNCSARYGAFPDGNVNERREGTGSYTQTPSASPSLVSIAWNPWFETGNNCTRTTVTRTNETRTIQTTSGRTTCDQPQRRTRVDTRTDRQSGGGNTVTSYDPDWTNNGGTTNCVTAPPPSSGGNDNGGGMNENSPGTSDSGQGSYGGGGGGDGGSGGSGGGGSDGGGPPAR